MGNRKISPFGSNGLQNIQASSINSSTSHLNYRNPFGSKLKQNRYSPIANKSFGDLSTTSLIYSNKHKMGPRVGSHALNSDMRSNGKMFHRMKRKTDSLRSSSLVSKKLFFIFSSNF